MLNRHLIRTSSALPAGALAIVLAAPAAGQTASHDAVVDLPAFVVSATRTPQDPKLTASSVSVVPLLDIGTMQLTDLSTALSQVPGVQVTTTGATGGTTKVSLRGANSSQTLLLVDGVRMNNRQNDFYMGSVLGGADLAGIDRIEVLRGPQSTLYGSSAMGGVILLSTAHGCGTPTGSVAFGAGSFDSFGAAVSEAGGTANLGYSVSLGYSETDNDRPNNHYERWSYATRVEYAPTSTTLIGATFRGQNGDYEEPNALAYADNPGVVVSDNYLGTLYGQVSVGERFVSRLTAGWHQNIYNWADTWGSDDYRTTRRILDWQNTLEPSTWATLVFGANAEWSHFASTTVTRKLSDRAYGLYASSDFHPFKELTLTAGLRYDDFNTAGDTTTGRLGASYWFDVSQTKLRATYGTGFNAPSMTERYGSSWYVASPDLRSEKSRGWDVGFDQHFFAGRLVWSSTYFRNRFRDMIVANPVAGSWKYKYENVSATTEGLENAVEAMLTKSLKLRAAYTYLDVRAAYTYLDVRNDTADTRVIYKPRHTADADLNWAVDPALTVGAGVHVVAGRLRTVTAEIEDYTTARLYASYAVNKNLLLKARIENALNEKYEESYGYPALPFRAFGGVEYKF